MTPEDELLVTKAALFGCEFIEFDRAPKSSRWYGAMSVNHPFNVWRYTTGQTYGYDDPVELAKDFVKFTTRTAGKEFP